MKTFFTIVLTLILCLCIIQYIKFGQLKNILFDITEMAYYEGQKDAIEGDIRIELDSCGNYHWIKSPWDSGREPVFNPANN